jgi:hypothetical protein
MPDPLPGCLLRVVDAPLNRTSTFWARYIGASARLIQIEGDGWTVAIEEPPEEGWVSSRDGMVVLSAEPPVGKPAANGFPVETWSKKLLPARFNPIVAANTLRFEVVAGPPELSSKRTWWQRLLGVFTGSREG